MFIVGDTRTHGQDDTIGPPFLRQESRMGRGVCLVDTPDVRVPVYQTFQLTAAPLYLFNVRNWIVQVSTYRTHYSSQHMKNSARCSYLDIHSLVVRRQ